MILEQYYLGCLSQASYLIGDEETRTGAIIDPRRDVDEYLGEAQARGLTIDHIFLTHFHADFASGHLELKKRTGASIYLGSPARADYPFIPLSDGQSVDFGKVRIKALATPGHTPESTCYLVFDLAADKEKPYAVFTGDTLFIGDVGRPDLTASQEVTAEDLASQLYDSLRGRILTLPDETIVYPGHGAGSMCGKNLGSETHSTIGIQRAMNYALQPMEKDKFVETVTAEQPKAPAYFPYNASFNRENHPLLEESLERALTPLSLEQVMNQAKNGAEILDVRSNDLFARSHLTGSINIDLEGRFASWAGTVLAHDKPIVIVSEPGRELEAVIRLGRIGYDQVVGYLEGGPAAFEGNQSLENRVDRLTASQLTQRLESPEPPLLLDVRGPGETKSRPINGSLHIPLNLLRERHQEVPRDREVVAICSAGYRSAIAASLLRKEGFSRIADLAGGMEAWAATETAKPKAG
jgi:glyoxylase-like metal-dependent hydrolase (beta-lactamase superfamily II)/rhodanese-related sulfurtransferase